MSVDAKDAKPETEAEKDNPHDDWLDWHIDDEHGEPEGPDWRELNQWLATVMK